MKVFTGMRAVALIGALASCLLSGSFASAADLDAVKRDLAAGKAVLIDVREVDEWSDGHLRDARLLPLSRIETGILAEELAGLAPAGKIIYLHCAAGGRCRTAAKLLQSTRRDLRALPQGYDELLQAGFPPAGR